MRKAKPHQYRTIVKCSVIVGCSHNEDGSGEHSDRDAVDDDDQDVVVVFHTTIIVEIGIHVQSYGDKMSEKQCIGLWDPYRFHAASMATLKYPDEFRNGTPSFNNGTPKINNGTPKINNGTPSFNNGTHAHDSQNEISDFLLDSPGSRFTILCVRGKRITLRPLRDS